MPLSLLLPCRDLTVFGMLVDPAAAMLVISGVSFVGLRWVLNHIVDLNRFVWRRPVFEIAMFLILYAAAILSLRAI
jgi:hypothetical protein